jgi:hypothetical protein
MVSGDSYILFKDLTNKKRRIANGVLNKDGHPSFCPTDRSRFITDTYPSKEVACDLIEFDMKDDSVKHLAKLKSIEEYDESPLRCDLHPKWSFCGKYVSVDTMNDGVRGIYLYEV